MTKLDEIRERIAAENSQIPDLSQNKNIPTHSKDEIEGIMDDISRAVSGHTECKDIRILDKKASDRLISLKIKENKSDRYPENKKIEALSVLFLVLIEESYAITEEIKNSILNQLGFSIALQNEILEQVKKDLLNQELTGIPILEEMPKELELELKEDFIDISVITDERRILKKSHIEIKRDKLKAEKIRKRIAAVSEKIDILLSKKQSQEALSLVQGLKDDCPEDSDVLALLSKVKKAVRKSNPKKTIIKQKYAQA
ncbi:MAG: hypothetical protein PHS92_00035 [Candidatus Gracilibacteria bacterium]|nr:hypothetical protein [Candidatus Gracilibacteria bacterium]